MVRAWPYPPFLIHLHATLTGGRSRPTKFWCSVSSSWRSHHRLERGLAYPFRACITLVPDAPAADHGPTGPPRDAETTPDAVGRLRHTDGLNTQLCIGSHTYKRRPPSPYCPSPLSYRDPQRPIGSPCLVLHPTLPFNLLALCLVDKTFPRNPVRLALPTSSSRAPLLDPRRRRPTPSRT
jgi:hypothetical protein